MKVFIDTNVILEFLMHREQVDVVERIFDKLGHNGDEMYMSAGGFYSVLYVLDNYLRKVLNILQPSRLAAMRAIGEQILSDIKVAGQDNAILLRGIRILSFTDLEDSCQYQTAIDTGCRLLLTFNKRDFPVSDDTSVKVITPSEFLLYSSIY